MLLGLGDTDVCQPCYAAVFTGTRCVAGVIAELSQCIATIFSLWLAAEPDQPAPAADASPQISTRASSVQPSSPPGPGSAVAAPQQHGGEDSVDAVSAAADEAEHGAEGADAAGGAVVSAVMEPIKAVEALAMRRPPARTAFISKEDLQLALRVATDAQPAAPDREPSVHERNSLAEASSREAPTDEDAAPAKGAGRSEQHSDAIIGATAAAAEGGISHGAGAARNAVVASGVPELHEDGSCGVAGRVGVADPHDGEDGSESEGVMDALMAPGTSSKAGSGTAYDGVGDAAAATAGNPAPDSGDDYSGAALDGMAVVDEGTAGKGFDVYGENGGSGIHELSDGFADGAFADWDVSADGAMQFGAPFLPSDVALLLSFGCQLLQIISLQHLGILSMMAMLQGGCLKLEFLCCSAVPSALQIRLHLRRQLRVWETLPHRQPVHLQQTAGCRL